MVSPSMVGFATTGAGIAPVELDDEVDLLLFLLSPGATAPLLTAAFFSFFSAFFNSCRIRQQRGQNQLPSSASSTQTQTEVNKEMDNLLSLKVQSFQAVAA